MALAREAGNLALGLQPGPGSPAAISKGAQDWLTEADGAVETLLRDGLLGMFPGDGFLGEEGGEAGAASPSAGPGSALRWVVDPIDGTSNFARGRQRWCVSIGLMEGQTPLLGVLVAPRLGETYRACQGQGAFLNDRRMRAADTTEMTRAMVELSWSPRVPAAAWRGAITRLTEAGAMPRSGGSGALGLADLAAGRLDGFIELDVNVWDVAGGLALLAETDGFVRHAGFPGLIVAGCAPLREALLAVADGG